MKDKLPQSAAWQARRMRGMVCFVLFAASWFRHFTAPSQMESHFAPPEYHTPDGVPRHWKYRLLPGATVQLLSELIFCLMLPDRRRALQGSHTPDDVARSCAEFAHMCEKTGARVHLTGLGHIADDRAPCVFVGNHMSTLETFLLPGIIHPFKPVTFVIKESILRQRLFGPIMKVMAPIAVTRQDPRSDLKTVLTEGLARLRGGVSLVVFPQTTRTLVFDPSRFNTLGEKLAKRAGVPIVPVAAKTDFWSPGKIFKDLGKIVPSNDIHIAFGEPMDSGGNPQRTHAAIIEFITGKLLAWGAKVGPAESAEGEGSRVPAGSNGSGE
jgi:1-acyl-sn-glycerol-3-phosphate acyltransferase